MRTYTIVVEPDQDGGYFVTVPALPGCFTRGSTIEECRERAVGPSRFTSQVFRPTASPFPRKSGRRDFWPSPSQPDVKAPVPPPALAGAGSSASLSGMRDSNGDHRCQRLPMSPAHQNGPLILVNGNRIQYSPAVDNTHPARRLHTLRTPGVQHSAARAGAARCDPPPAWDDAFTATGNYVDAAPYPEEPSWLNPPTVRPAQRADS